MWFSCISYYSRSTVDNFIRKQSSFGKKVSFDFLGTSGQNSSTLRKALQQDTQIYYHHTLSLRIVNILEYLFSFPNLATDYFSFETEFMRKTQPSLILSPRLLFLPTLSNMVSLHIRKRVHWFPPCTSALLGVISLWPLMHLRNQTSLQ